MEKVSRRGGSGIQSNSKQLAVDIAERGGDKDENECGWVSTGRGSGS